MRSSKRLYPKSTDGALRGFAFHFRPGLLHEEKLARAAEVQPFLPPSPLRGPAGPTSSTRSTPFSALATRMLELSAAGARSDHRRTGLVGSAHLGERDRAARRGAGAQGRSAPSVRAARRVLRGDLQSGGDLAGPPQPARQRDRRGRGAPLPGDFRQAIWPGSPFRIRFWSAAPVADGVRPLSRGTGHACPPIEAGKVVTNLRKR
jgi:hypothetical protein